MRLAQALAAWRGRPDLIVLALPRGGVPVAAEVAKALGAPLDVVVVRKLGYPGQEEFAMGAIASGGVRVMSDIEGAWPVSDRAVEAAVLREVPETIVHLLVECELARIARGKLVEELKVKLDKLSLPGSAKAPIWYMVRGCLVCMWKDTATKC